MTELERYAQDLWIVRQVVPAGTMQYSLSYLLFGSDGDVAIVDPGWDTDENWARLVDALASAGRDIADVRWIVGTHLHRDHIGMTDRVRRASGASFLLTGREQEALAALGSPASVDAWIERIAGWGASASARAELEEASAVLAVPAAGPADAVVQAADRIPLPGWDLRVIATPGHTAGHLCLVDTARGLLFTGDHVLPITNSGLGLGGPSASNPIADFLDSLRAVSAFEGSTVLPGHEHVFDGIAARCSALESAQLTRAGEVSRALEALGREASVWELASMVTWSAGWANLHGMHLRSALAQTEWHAERLRAL